VRIHPSREQYRERDLFEEQFVNQLFGLIADAMLGWVGDELAATRLAFPSRLASMNGAVLDDLCSLTIWAVHRCGLGQMTGDTFGQNSPHLFVHV
jgi:hypothetical protein